MTHTKYCGKVDHSAIYRDSRICQSKTALNFIMFIYAPCKHHCCSLLWRIATMNKNSQVHIINKFIIKNNSFCKRKTTIRQYNIYVVLTFCLSMANTPHNIEPLGDVHIYQHFHKCTRGELFLTHLRGAAVV